MKVVFELQPGGDPIATYDYSGWWSGFCMPNRGQVVAEEKSNVHTASTARGAY
jgi:hypothetical protein